MEVIAIYGFGLIGQIAYCHQCHQSSYSDMEFIGYLMTGILLEKRINMVGLGIWNVNQQWITCCNTYSTVAKHHRQIHNPCIYFPNIIAPNVLFDEESIHRTGNVLHSSASCVTPEISI